METLFELPPVAVKKESQQPPNSRCRNCRHIANLNPYSDRYWYCKITPSIRTPYGFQAVKRMRPACSRFENENKE